MSINELLGTFAPRGRKPTNNAATMRVSGGMLRSKPAGNITQSGLIQPARARHESQGI